MAKVRMYWDYCITCHKRLKTAKEKQAGYCKICGLKRELGLNQVLLNRVNEVIE